MLQRLSNGLARCEEITAAALAAAVTCLILTNIAFRALGSPLYWVSELAIYAMIWMTFLIAGAVLKRRHGIAVTLVSDLLPSAGRKWVIVAVDTMVLLFALMLVWLCWRWYQPLTLAQTGFDIRAFQGQTFNFIYAENTSTLGEDMELYNQSSLPKYRHGKVFARDSRHLPWILQSIYF